MTDFSARREMMVDTQVRPSDVTKFPIIAAMLRVPREVYVPPALREAAYLGGNLRIAAERELIEARTLAKMLEALDLQPGARVLHLACGLGYGTAVMAQLCHQVTGIEDSAELAGAAGERLAGQGVSNARVLRGPLDAPTGGPYDAIVIEGGVEEVGEAVLSQLAEGGRIAAIFMQGALGVVRIGTRAGGVTGWRDVFNASASVLGAFERTRAFTL
ncbi:MAG: protein-L-isoaspartate O-methyltransferase family protein [Paracoccaceae bacterium]